MKNGWNFKSSVCALLAACATLAFGQSSWGAYLNRGGWVVSASVSDGGSPPGQAIDGNISTRWGSGTQQTNGMWFLIDTGAGTPPTFNQLVLDCGGATGDYPRGYQVNVSSDGVNWGNPVATGAGSSAVTTINFASQTARYIRITQTGSVSGLWWSIAELNVSGLGPPPPPTAATAVPGNNQVSLSWVAASGAVNYGIARSTAYNGPYTVLSSNWTATSYVDTGAVSGVFYFYQITANNSYGSSAPSLAMYGPRVVTSTLNPSDTTVAITTPQEYGAVGDGMTDDSAAFQRALNAVYNSGGPGGGVVYVPAGNYAFYTNLTIPTGVTLHGDWRDWYKRGENLVGATFKVYFGAGQSSASPFIVMNGSSTLRGVNLWYPNQNADNISSYPFAIGMDSDCVIKDVALVNPYQGIETYNGGGDRHILSTVIGTPLLLGVNVDDVYDISHAEDVRFSPAVWAQSGVSNAPLADPAFASWLRNHGTALRLVRVDGELCMDTFIDGYNLGILFTNTGNGDPGITFTSGSISNCAVAIMPQNMPGGLGLMFANFTLDGDLAILRTRPDTDANLQFDHCTIIGRTGPAVAMTGADSGSLAQFQECTISNSMNLTGPGVLNLVDCTLLGATQCVMSAAATRASFTGCAFYPVQNIVNQGNPGSLLLDPRAAPVTAIPIVYWTNILNDCSSRQPAKKDLFLATSYGAVGNGIADDTAAIQSALAAAGANGGGYVYVPAGLYHLTNTLDVPSGVELRGANELRHWPGAAADGKAKGSVLHPYGGQGTTNGPVAVALEANAGLVGFAFSYETQDTNCIPFPPAIQGRGGNIYVIGAAAANPYYYVDLDSYACTNHFLYLVDGWPIKIGFNVGNGSSGSIVDDMGNWTYWINNGQSQSTLPQNVQAPVIEFVAHQSQAYVLGDCTELMVKNFNIIENTYLRTRTENGRGPVATLVGDYCDATIQGIVLDAAGPSAIQAVNLPLCVFNFNNDTDLNTSTVDILATTNFQGAAHLNNISMFAEPWSDVTVNGGDVTLASAHMNSSLNGSQVNAGAFHLLNLSADTVGGNSPYHVAFGPHAGLPSIASDYIGCFSQYGYTFTNASATNLVDVWGNFGMANYPPVPSRLTATNTAGQVNLTWMVAGSANSFNLRRSATSGGSFEFIGTVTVTNFTDTNVSAGATYYYEVTSLNQYGESAGSAVVGTRDGLLARNGWIATASGGEPAVNAIDGNPATRWSTDALQTPGEWFQVDLGAVHNVFEIVLDATASPNDYPRGYQVTVSTDGVNWSGPIATGVGSVTVTTISFPPQAARYLRITQTGSASGNYWSIHEFYAYGRPPDAPGNLLSVANANPAVLTWNPSAGATAYNIKYSLSPDGTYTVVSSNWNAVAFTNLNLPPNMKYYYVVSAVNADGESGNSLPATAIVGAPPQLTLTASADNSIHLAWPTNNNGAAFTVVSATNLVPPVIWIPATNLPALSTGQWIITLPGATNQTRFYRLQQ